MPRNPNTNCSICSEPVYKRPKEIKSGPVYCSQSCYGFSCRKPKICLCGKEYLGNNKYCSKSCSNKGRTGIKYEGRPLKDKVKTSKILRKRLTKLRGYNCEICLVSNWQDKPLTLQLDHINGIRTDNRLENLRLLCPNCHSQTETWGIRNYLLKKKKSGGPIRKPATEPDLNPGEVNSP